MLLEKGRNADAIAIFKLNVEEYPKSGNVYGSLAEAYAKDVQKQQAITNYRKSLAARSQKSERGKQTERARTKVAEYCSIRYAELNSRNVPLLAGNKIGRAACR